MQLKDVAVRKTQIDYFKISLEHPSIDNQPLKLSQLLLPTQFGKADPDTPVENEVPTPFGDALNGLQPRAVGPINPALGRRFRARQGQ